jgi:isocitrate lyase
MVWMETPTADVADAKDFMEKVRGYDKDIMLAYNLSPSFNWS